MSTTPWRRVIASGAFWTVTYNFIWAIAWFSFMRHEWAQALAASKKESPWTAEVWFLWVALTLPIGIAIMAYTHGRASSSLSSAVAAGGVLALMMSAGMTAWGLQESLPLRVLLADAAVNLAGMLAASVAGVWSLRDS